MQNKNFQIIKKYTTHIKGTSDENKIKRLIKRIRLG